MVGVGRAAEQTKSASASGMPVLACGATLVGLTVLYAARVFVEAGRRLWFDELLTYYIAKAPTISDVLNLVKTWDLSPPTAHLLAHYSMRLFGANAIGVRFPSIVEFYIASLMLLWYVARKVGFPYGVAAVLVLWASPTFYYATEARPYALMSMWFCCLLVSWDIASTAQRRKLALWAVAISGLGLIESHVFAPFSLLPFFAAEVVRSRKRRKLDFPLWLTLLLPLIGVLGYIPLFKTYKTIHFYPPLFQASLKKMASFYWHGGLDIVWFAGFALLAALLASRAANKVKAGWRKPEHFRAADLTLFALLIANPIFLNVILMRDHAPFWPRYCITSIFGFYILFGLFLAAAFRSKPQPGYAAVLLLAGMILVLKIAIPAYDKSMHGPAEGSAALARVKPDLPLVAASGATFVEMGHYEPQATLSRLFYLKDRAAAIRYAHATMFEDLDRFSHAFALPGKVEQYVDFTRDHREFLVLGTFDYPEDWLLRRLAVEKARIVLVGTFPIPYKDTALYDVTLTAPRAKEAVSRPASKASQAAPAASANSG